MKNRYKELNLAEKHYVAAITVLSPPEILSPASTTSWTRRSSNASSFDYNPSTASSVTSYNSDREDSESDHSARSPTRSWHVRSSSSFGSFSSMSSMSPKFSERRGPNFSSVSTRPPSVSQLVGYPIEEYQGSADTSDFIQAIRGHLASVRDLKKKTAPPVVRFNFPEPPSTSPTPMSPTAFAFSAASTPRTSLVINEDNADKVRQLRRTVKFRERFDPTSVRRLCSEALWELS